ncbi:hypothetical protein Sango_2054100 [Sesamum angolense]|uniref:MULE transposase domain-containing protein n=1 Tax=Sesamum angolense TaxID=2727404 RepID=A0AAE2BPE8_9LAMI|nr:hypothetical protein Sango_2054100 [Sesamum angolense]
MVLANYADFDVWVGGVIEWVPTVRLLNGDDGIIELLRAYNGLDVIPLYFEEKQGPLLQDLPITNEPEYAYEAHPELGQTSENPPSPSQTPENPLEPEYAPENPTETEQTPESPHEPEQIDGNFPENPPIEGLSDEGGDDSDSGGSDSSASQCPSWMLEDLEGPPDDDIFESRPDGHARKLFKIMRVFLREQKKKRRVEREQREQKEKTIRESGWFSDDGEEDEFVSLRGSDDEGDGFPVWNDRMDGGDVDLQVGMKFATREKYRDVLRDWAVRRGSHTCAHKTENRQANYKHIGRKIEHIIRDNPNEGLEPLKNKIRRDIQIDCSLHKVYRAKRYTQQLVKGNIKKQYERLYDYCATVEKHNPRSTLVLTVDRSLTPPVLQRMYYCLNGLREGFLEGCRPIIGLDGCFLKGPYKGQLLSAVGRDGNDNIYPIAIAYVEIEKFDTWE